MSGTFRRGETGEIHTTAVEQVEKFEMGHGLKRFDRDDATSKVDVMRTAAQLAIQEKYEQIGRSLSPLGLPVSMAATRSSDGMTYQMDYNGGHIVFDADTGTTQAVSTKEALVTFKGLKCFGRQGGIGLDQPYVVMSVVQTDPTVMGDEIQVATYRVPADGTFTDVDDGAVRTEGAGRKFWASAPQDVIINSVVMEHDSGDPDKVKTAIKDALKKAADAGVAAATGGAATAPMNEDTLQGMAVDWLAGKLTDLLGTGDDKLGSGSIVTPVGTWMNGNFPAMMHRDGIDYNYKQYCTDGDASYDVMYEVHLDTVTHILS